MNDRPVNEQWAPLLVWALAAMFVGCSTAATFEGMVPTSFETVNAHPQTVRVRVSGGQESVALGRPQITNAAFTQALVASITRSRTFAKVIEDTTPSADYLLTVTLFSMEKLVFGQRVSLEAGWTLQRADTGAIVWRESITSQSTHSDIQQATEAVARINIGQALTKMSKLNL